MAEISCETKHATRGCGGHLCHKHHAADAHKDHIYSLEHLRGVIAAPPITTQAPTLARTTKKRGRGKKTLDQDNDVEAQPEKKQEAVAPCTVFPPCPIHCGYGKLCAGCKTHCPQLPSTTTPSPPPSGGGDTVPTPLPSPPPSIPPPTAPTPNQPITQVTLPSAYLGNVPLNVIDRGNGWYELTATVTNGSRTIIIKTIDSQKNAFSINSLPLLSAVAQMPPMVIHRDELAQAANVVATLRHMTTRNTTQDAQYAQALNVLAPVDSHFAMQQYPKFLYQMTGLTSILGDNVNFLAAIVNVPAIDNAFWADYMCICDGKDYFYNFATLDILGLCCLSTNV